ncbi:hypothetical protein BOX15_Mlig013851g1, partial [Macrostomum lignano]
CKNTMHKLVHLPINQLNEHITCRLCQGYLIDATTIVECLHAFCRSCLLTHLTQQHACPVCDIQLHKGDPYRAIRLDRALQSLVYKLVPGLFKSEMTRRRQFYVEHPSAGSDRALSPEKRGDLLAPETASLVQDDERVSLSLELADTKRIRNGRLLRTDCVDQTRACYLLAPACLTVQQLQKFLRLKLDLRPTQSIAIFYTEDCLHADFSIMDIAYVYAWRRKGPLRLFYTVLESAAARASAGAAAAAAAAGCPSSTFGLSSCSASDSGADANSS